MSLLITAQNMFSAVNRLGKEISDVFNCFALFKQKSKNSDEFFFK